MIRNDNTGHANSHDVRCLTTGQRDLYKRTRRYLDDLVAELTRVDFALEDFGRNPHAETASALSLSIAEAESAMHALATHGGDHESANARNVDHSMVEQAATPDRPRAGSDLTPGTSRGSGDIEPSAEQVDEISRRLRDVPWLSGAVYAYIEQEASYGNQCPYIDIELKFSAFKRRDIRFALNQLIAVDLIVDVANDLFELNSDIG